MLRPDVHRHPVEFDQLSRTYNSYSGLVSFLITVLGQLLRLGHQTHLEELAIKLDFSGWYTTRTHTTST
jgi:hypothetical protein